MLIHLDSSLIRDAAETTGSGAKSRAVVERALLAHGYGKHLLSFLREDYKRLHAMREVFSERAKIALLDAHQRLSETLGRKDELSWVLLLGLGTQFNGEVTIENRRHVIRADAHRFEDPERLGRTILLGENRTDARLYRLLAQTYSALKGWRQMLGFQLDGGGGSTIDGEFDERCGNDPVISTARCSMCGLPKICSCHASMKKRWPMIPSKAARCDH